MAASDNINRILFADQFRRLHGMTVEQAKQGYSNFSNTLLTPEETEETWNFLGRHKKEGPWKEHVASVLERHTPIENLVSNWASDHTSFLVGQSASVARDITDFSHEMNTQAKSIPTRVYRGAKLSPQEQITRSPDAPLSFTEDQHVARSFAKSGGMRGNIFKVDPGQAKGLYVPDYVGRQRTVGQGRRPEREWIVDPDTLR